MDINEIAKQYTREDFIDNASDAQSEFYCPRTKLEYICASSDYSKDECIKCWSNAVKEIKFKGDEDEFIKYKKIK